MQNSDIKKIKQYASIKNRLHLINILFLAALLLIFLFSGLSNQLKYLTHLYINNFYLSLALYFLIFAVSFHIISLPLEYYDSFIIEHRFSLSRHTKVSWLKDNIKKGLLSLTLGFLTIEILYFFLKNFPQIWWLFTAVVWFFISIILSKLLPVVILPLFYKQKLLENEQLRQRLFNLCKKANKKIKGIYSIDLSKETKKANAALVGSGKTRRILLSDTLLDEYNHDEIEVILAHELAHHNLRHMPKLLVIGGILSSVGFYIAYVLLNKTVALFNLENIYDISGFPILMFIFLLFSVTIMPLQNAFSRKLEKDADIYALKLTKLHQAFINAMQKLTKQNLSDPNPSKFIEIILYDHPPTSKRISLAHKLKEGIKTNKI